jgi:hypothetical protein
VTFHTDSNDGISKFHIDVVDALPPGTTLPPWSVTAVPIQPPSGPWYVKPAYPDYAPSGMPDFDEKQDAWGPGPGIYTWCAPVAVANSLWWLDSKYEPNDRSWPNIIDNFPLVTSYNQGWDDHDPQNVDPFVRDLAWFLDTDGLRTGDGHTGTQWIDVQSGIQQYLVQQGMAGMFEVHNASYPEFPWIEQEIEKCQDVELFLEFWQWTGTSWQKLYDNPSLEWGHFVTCAGVNSSTSELLISDPWHDAFEEGTAPKGGRSPVPHPPIHPTSFHNDAQFVSQDAYTAVAYAGPPPPYPVNTTVWELQGYLQALNPPYPQSYHAFIRGAVATSPSGTHDVAVTDITTCKSKCYPTPTVCRAYNAQVNVTVENQGNFTETFNVVTYANNTAIGTQTVTGLAPQARRTLTFTWNTTGYAISNYTIKAVADIVSGETDVADNTLVDNELLKVVIVGDVTGDDIVEMMDFYYASLAFGSTPDKPNWCPNADIYSWPDGDGIIEMMDFYVLSQHFGEHYP